MAQQPLNQITTIRLPNGSQVAFVDWSDRPLYSTCDILNGATDETYPLFSYVNGNSVSSSSNITVKRTASLLDTNISLPSKMDSTEEFLLYAIKPEYNFLRTASGTTTDATSAIETGPMNPCPLLWRLQSLFRMLILQLTVSQKVMQQAPLGYFNTGFGAFGVATSSNVATTQPAGGATAGVPQQTAVRSLGIPVHIGGQEVYGIELLNPANNTLTPGLASNATTSDTTNDTRTLARIRVFMDGLYKRPVS